MIRVLLVEDNLGLAGNIIDYLELEDMACDHVANGIAALNLMNAQRFDVIILDINLPKMDGFRVCEHVRNQGDDTPIIMLTARDKLESKLEGFQMGADDYLVKPFEMAELVARVITLSTRRSGQIRKLQFGNVSLDLKAQIASVNESLLKLSPTTFKILQVLLREQGNAVSRQRLIDAVWKDEAPESNTLKVHIHNLRKLLAQGGSNIEVKALPNASFCIALTSTPSSKKVADDNDIEQTDNKQERR
ncbi:response regulator transcription factor [Cycloclasticus sp. P1]|uniref:response regulator transcription factor n=1 Tax=Cycloclasticus sp. (strain P1) TaxID=385025 RepID=UPI0002F114ED|nr:response regulator transcription factor [Cycloclasticus sp. P1]